MIRNRFSICRASGATPTWSPLEILVQNGAEFERAKLPQDIQHGLGECSPEHEQLAPPNRRRKGRNAWHAEEAKATQSDHILATIQEVNSYINECAAEVSAWQRHLRIMRTKLSDLEQITKTTWLLAG